MKNILFILLFLLLFATAQTFECVTTLINSGTIGAFRSEIATLTLTTSGTGIDITTILGKTMLYNEY